MSEWYTSQDGSYFHDKNTHLFELRRFLLLLQCPSCGYQDKCESPNAFLCRNMRCTSQEAGEFVLFIKYNQTWIWAYNEEHLDYLEAFVKAKVRRQPNRYTHSIFATLPSIYRSKKHREHVLSKLRVLRSRIKSNKVNT